MKKLLTSILLFFTSVSGFIFQPWYNFKEINFIKKEASFKLDGNQAIEQISSIINTISLPSEHSINLKPLVIESTSNKVSEIIEEVQKTAEIVDIWHTTNIELSNSFIFSALAVLFFSFVVCGCLAFKVAKLKRKLANLFLISKKLNSTCRHLAQSYYAIANSLEKNRNLQKDLNLKIKKLTEDLKNSPLLKTSERTIEKLKKNNMIILNEYSKIFKKELMSTKPKIFEFLKEKAIINTRLLNKKFFDRKLSKNTHLSPAYVMCSAVSLMAFYGIINYGLEDTYSNDFISTISEETFVSYGDYSSNLNINEFSIPSKNLNFTSRSIENHITAFRNSTLKRTEAPYNSLKF